MKNQYQLIAFDMDGTLLTTDKKIAPETTRAMQEAVQAGKQIVLSTGRTDAELAAYRSALADVRYGILESGGLLYDFHERRILSCKPIAPEYVQKILELSEQEDVMIQVMAGGKVYIQTKDLDNMAHYQLAYFYPLFSTTALLIDDIRAWLREEPSLYLELKDCIEMIKEQTYLSLAGDQQPDSRICRELGEKISRIRNEV